MSNPLPRYYADMQCTQLSTTVLSSELRDGLVIVTLADTIFHPQGGGQPADRGEILGSQGILKVTQVKKREDGAIEHIGIMSDGMIEPGEEVLCEIDTAWRQLHSRLHSAGHLLDVVLDQLSIQWQPGKGYHFADGPYVEYLTQEVPDAELAARIEAAAATLIATNIPTTIDLQGTTRIVRLGDKSVPCGGTHVQALGEIGSLHIRYIKQKQGVVKIGYNISP